MKMKNIGPADFARHHPGGQLGRRLLLTVGDVMRKDDENPVISGDRPVEEMIVQITAFLVGAISVMSRRGELLGLVTDYDIRKALASKKGISSMRITDIMNPSPIVVFNDQMAVEALEVMRKQEETHNRTASSQSRKEKLWVWCIFTTSLRRACSDCL